MQGGSCRVFDWLKRGFWYYVVYRCGSSCFVSVAFVCRVVVVPTQRRLIGFFERVFVSYLWLCVHFRTNRWLTLSMFSGTWGRVEGVGVNSCAFSSKNSDVG